MLAFLARLFGRSGGIDAATRAEHAGRAEQWTVALEQGDLPPFVTERLEEAAHGHAPWMATMTPAELLLAKSHGIRPLATVSGTCWLDYGWSWTEGHAQGWAEAQDRLRREARACGANAVVDVRMRTIRQRFGQSMDFSLIGTAVRIDRLPPSPDPVIATVPALEFVRLLEMGIVPTGIAVGARYEWVTDNWGGLGGRNSFLTGRSPWASFPLTDLGAFWNQIRRDAHADLRRHAASIGNGVLAHINFGQLLKREVDKQPDSYLGRHIVIGTVVETHRGDGVPHGIAPVIDMAKGPSPLAAGAMTRHTSYDTDATEQEGAI